MTKDIVQLTKEENTLFALLKFWGSCGHKLTKKLDSNNKRILKLPQIQSLLQKIWEIDINSRTELKEASKEIANYINRDFLNQTFNNFKTSGNEPTRIFLKVAKAKLNSKNKIKPNTFMSFWERKPNQYDRILENPMIFAGPGTGSLMGRENHGYIVVKVPEGFPILETRNYCDPDEVLISSNDLLNLNCVMTFIPRFVEPEFHLDKPSFFQKLFSK